MSLKTLDTFTGTDGTALASHTGDTSHGWTEPAWSPGEAEISSNRLSGISTPAVGYYQSGYNPAVADYEIGATMFVAATNNFAGGLIGRFNFTFVTGYILWWSDVNLRWDLLRIDGGSFTVIGNSATNPATTERKVRLKFIGSRMMVYSDDALVIDATDATYGSAGNVGVVGPYPDSVATAYLDDFYLRTSSGIVHARRFNPALLQL